MASVPVRLSVTSVRPAEPHDFRTLRVPPPPGDEIALVIGQPALGLVRLAPPQDDRDDWTITALHPPRYEGTVPTLSLTKMLFHAAYGLALDGGRDRITTPLTLAEFAAEGFTRQASGGLVRSLSRNPVPVPAVSVIPLRERSAGLEVFVQHRVATMDFVPGAVVFPGGRIDPQDADLGASLDLPGSLDEVHAERWSATGYVASARDTAAAARTLLATGVREVAEETGAFLAPERLLPWDNWVTPVDWPRRFDVSFFVVAADDHDAFGHTTTEAHTSEWLPVAEVVARVEARTLAMVSPTRTMLDELQSLRTLDAILSLEPPIPAVHHDLTPRRPRRWPGYESS